MDESAATANHLLFIVYDGVDSGAKKANAVLLEQVGRNHLSLTAATAHTGRIYVGGQDHWQV